MNNRNNTSRRPARGSTYMLVLSSSLIVSTIGLASLQLMRLQGQTASESNNFAETRAYARAALEIGMLKIRNDPYWRTNLGNGNWVTNQAIGTGTFTLSATDPIDNDVTKGDNHPVILTGIGMKGTSVFKTSVRMEVGPRVGSCLEVSMISGSDSTVNSATLTSDQTVSANGQYHAQSGAVVNANVEAFKNINGATYTQAKLQKTVARDMPDPLHALDYYTSHGTTIQYSALPQWTQTELIVNPKFETDVSGWYPLNTCVFQRSSTQAKEGIYSLLVKSRSTSSDVAAQDLPNGVLSSGNKYHLSVPIFPSAAGTAKGILTLTSTGEGVQVLETPIFTLAKDIFNNYNWVDLNADFVPTWTGTLTKATVSIWISVKNNYYMDKVSLLDVTYPNGYYVIDKQLLSPTVNPFGSTNAQGIYVINCAGKNVVLGRSRIVGTLVFLSTGGSTVIDNSVIWEPAIYNYPALLSNNVVNINLDSAGLSEASLEINLNPPGTPYPFIGGTTDATQTESYPSKITGLLYTTKDFNFTTTPTIQGVVLAANNITVSATSLNLNYGNIYLNTPPPGFNIGTITMKVVPGTWQRTVN